MAGGSGFIGNRVVTILLDAGAKEIVIIGRTEGPIKHKRVRYAACDLSKETAIDVITGLGSFDYIFNLIGMTDQRMPHPNPVELFDMNVRTLIHLTRGIDWKPVRGAVHAGTNAEYGLQRLPQQEDMLPQPTNMYGWSKASATLYARAMTQAKLAKWCIARPFFVYGSGKTTGFIPELISTLKQGTSFTVGPTTRDPVFVDDCADALVQLALCPSAKGEIVNICGGKEVPVVQIAAMAQKKIKKGTIVLTKDLRPGDVRRSRGSITKLKRLTGWRPRTTLSQGLDMILKE